jgi:hypothetical protein
MYANVDPILADIQKKLDELLLKQKSLDRLSVVGGIDKYDSSAFSKTLN